MLSIIVIYNMDVQTCDIYQMLIKQPDIDVIVCDNSTEPTSNRQTVEGDGATYLFMEGNHGLSKAYNAALDQMIMHPQDYVILFDQDTIVHDDYFPCVRHSIQTRQDIYFPTVKTANQILSPAVIADGVVSALDGEDHVPIEEMTAINSGMVIRMGLFTEYRYPESLFLDYVDHAFIAQMKQRNCSMVWMPVTITQAFSAETKDKEQARKRFAIFKKDSEVFYRDIIANKRACAFVVNKRKLRLLLQYKDIRIVKW